MLYVQRRWHYEDEFGVALRRVSTWLRARACCWLERQGRETYTKLARPSILKVVRAVNRNCNRLVLPIIRYLELHGAWSLVLPALCDP